MATIDTSVQDEAKGTYVHVMDVLKSSTERTGEYVKSLWELNTKPYGGGDFDANLREAFARADESITLMTKELEATAHSSIEIIETIVEASLAINRKALGTLNTFAKRGADNFKAAAEKAGDRLEHAADRLGEKVSETAHAH